MEQPAKSPPAPAAQRDNRFKLLDRTIARHQGAGNALIEVLHSAQEIFGFLADDILAYVASALKRPQSQVYGVATFYNFFRLKPAGKHTVVVCTGTACYVKGAAELQGALEKRCGCKIGETSKDGQVSLMQARCIGSCGLAPVAVLDEEVGAKLTPQKLLERVDEWLRPTASQPRPSGGGHLAPVAPAAQESPR